MPRPPSGRRRPAGSLVSGRASEPRGARRGRRTRACIVGSPKVTGTALAELISGVAADELDADGRISSRCWRNSAGFLRRSAVVLDRVEAAAEGR